MVYYNSYVMLSFTNSVKKYEAKHRINIFTVCIVLILALFVPKILAINNLPCVHMDCFVIFFVGYYFSKFKVKINLKSFLLFGIGLFVFAVLCRLVAKQLFDETFQDLYQLIVPFTHSLTAISVFFIVSFLTERINMLKTIANTKLWIMLDKYSYLVYITHYAFLNSVTSVTNFNFNIYFTVILFFLFTIVSSFVLYHLSNLIQKLFK